MADAVWNVDSPVDVAIMAAAVSDFRPSTTRDVKLAREDGPPHFELEPTPDVLGGVRERGLASFVVGFAAEAGSLDRARDKAADKGVDLLVANDIAREGSGFGSDTNEVTLVHTDGSLVELPLMPKSEVAEAILDAVVELRA